jgi:hypothetical protein
MHHIPPEELAATLEAMSGVKASRHLVTVPREDLSVQVAVRRTGGRSRALRLSGGARVKRLLRRKVIRSAPSGLWMLDGRGGVTRARFRAMLERHFVIEDEYVLTDDPAHVFYVLRGARP